MNWKDQLMTAVQQNIERTGLHITGVFDPEGKKPTLCYTTGLRERYGFEVLCSGLPPEYAEPVLNSVHEAMKASGLKTGGLKMGKPDDRFTNLPVVFKFCGASAQSVNGVSRKYYGAHYVRMAQMVMCDRQGRFPWDPQFDHQYMDSRQTRYWV